MNTDPIHQAELDRTGFWGKRGAGVLFKARSTGRILIAHRSEEVEQPGTWGTWGGAMDPNETEVEAAIREAEEEAGYTPSHHDIALLHVFEHESGFRYTNFLVRTPAEFDPIMNWETQGFAWVNYGEWPNPLHFGLQDVFNNPIADTILQL